MGGGGSHFLKCLGRKFFGEELNFFGFAWGGLTLDDTMQRVGPRSVYRHMEKMAHQFRFVLSRHTASLERELLTDSNYASIHIVHKK